MKLRLGAPEESILVTQGNLSSTYQALGRLEEALSMRRDVYSGFVRILGEEDRETLREANNYAADLCDLQRHAEAKSLLRKMIPVARRVLGENDDLPFRMRKVYAKALYKADGSTLDDLREAVTALEEATRTARRVMGGAHPLSSAIEGDLRDARATLRARETPSMGAA